MHAILDDLCGTADSGLFPEPKFAQKAGVQDSALVRYIMLERAAGLAEVDTIKATIARPQLRNAQGLDLREADYHGVGQEWVRNGKDRRSAGARCGRCSRSLPQDAKWTWTPSRYRSRYGKGRRI